MCNLTRFFVSTPLALCVLWIHPAQCAGIAYVDAVYRPGAEHNVEFNNFSWDGTFMTATSGTEYEKWAENVDVSGRGDVISIAYYTEHNEYWLNDQTARAQVWLTLNPGHSTPRLISFPKDKPPMEFDMTLRGWSAPPKGGYYRLLVRVRKWSGLSVPKRCSVSSTAIDLGEAANDAVVSSTGPLSIKCNDTVDYRLTVRAAEGGDLITYSSGGKIRMSIDGSVGPSPNVTTGRAEKNIPIPINVRATTVPGTALPGKYTASAVVTVEIL
ncbi:hypothetical protein SMKC072_02470 [Serratia marcescens]|nr:hypothetical protein SMKC056_02430 [Serratia marcescens]BEN62425.1 hypothetical protein SMKC072_02470 [Serratia marcescens]BEO16891.1 hypothetical protein SMQC19_02380 [Serratia marcescens]